MGTLWCEEQCRALAVKRGCVWREHGQCQYVCGVGREVVVCWWCVDGVLCQLQERAREEALEGEVRALRAQMEVLQHETVRSEGECEGEQQRRK